MKYEEKQEFAKKISDILQIISNPVRLLLLCHLLEKESNVSEMLKKITISQSALSQHIAILRKNNIISATKKGQFIHYNLADNMVKSILLSLQKLCEK
jgi:DNA-binding transcriptional ArsR family regulator